MSRLVMWNLMSLDGAFEGAAKWDLGWHASVLGEEFQRFAIEQLRSADRLLFGRVTYEGMAAHWHTAHGEVAGLMNLLPKFVFTRQGDVRPWSNTTVVRGDAVSEVRALKAAGEHNSFVFGSANLCATLIVHDLFDEYRVLVAPVLLGSASHLFKDGGPRRTLRLLEARVMSGNGVLLRYEPAGGT